MQSQAMHANNDSHAITIRCTRNSQPFARSTKAFGRRINTNKTKMLYQPTPKAQDNGQSIYIDNEELASVQKFKYLGFKVASNNKMDDELYTGQCFNIFWQTKEEGGVQQRSDIQNQMFSI